MQKLTLLNRKAMACFVLICLFLAQSCKKNSTFIPDTVSDKQLISADLIKNWQVNNPAAAYFALDWQKAKQAQIQGKNVVSVPLINIDQISVIKGKSPKANANLNYNEARPPEVFFIQDGPGKKLRTYILNFIPKDNTTDGGRKGQQSGKLYEWNFSGDTIAVQNLEKGKLVEKYFLKYGGAPQLSDLNATVKEQKLASINIPKNKLTSNIFTWLLDKVEDFVGWAGHFFGASTWSPNNIFGQTVEDGGWRLNGGNGETVDYIAADDYGGGGGGSTGLYNIFLQYSEPNAYEPYPNGPNVVIQNFVADYVANKYQLDHESRSFLYTRLDVAEAIRAYGEINPVGQNEIDFVKWAVGYIRVNNPSIDLEDFKRDFLTKDIGLDTSNLGTDGANQNMNYSIYFDNVDGDFKVISNSDPNYNNLINNGTSSLPINFAPCTTQALRQMGRNKGWDVGVSPLEFNRRVGQAFQEAVFKLYNQKLLPVQRLRVKYQPQNNISLWRRDKLGNTGQVIPDWTYDVNFMGVSAPLSQHWFYDAKAVTGFLYLSSSKYQIGGYIDVLSKKKVPNAPPPAIVFVTPINTIISPSILFAANTKGVQVRQAFVVIINNQLYLLNSIEITPTNDKFTNIPTNLLKILSGPVDLEYPINPNNGPDYEEIQ